MVRLLAVLIIAACVCACQTTRSSPADRVRVGEGVFLTLPQPPGYAHRQSVVQLVDATYQNQHQLFQSVVSLSDDAVKVVITVPSGPRILTIDWTSSGIRTKRAPMVPAGLKADNILADLVILFWDLDSINVALAGTATAIETGSGRAVVQDGRIVMSIVSRDGMLSRGDVQLTNQDFGYHLNIRTISVDDT